jgi:hypothetical protein
MSLNGNINYLTVQEAQSLIRAAHERMYSEQHIRVMCVNKELEGAVKRGRDWLIPEPSVWKFKPKRAAKRL